MIISAMKRAIPRIPCAVLIAAVLTGCFPWPRPAWSPDGKQVAFLAEDGIWVAERTTWKTRPVYRSARLISRAAWADKGSTLYCLEASADCRQVILRKVPTDGGAAETVHAFECPRETVHDMVDGEDGVRVCLDLSSHPSAVLVALELVTPDDGWATHVFDTDARRTVAILDGQRGPRWSPDGKMLACVRVDVEDAGREVVVYSVREQAVAKQRSMRLGDEEPDADDPAHLSWSSDSRLILTDDSEDIWLVHADGSKPAEKIAEGVLPSLMPGSSKYALLRSEGRNELALFLQDLNTTNEVELAWQNAGFMPSSCPLSWSPDGELRATVWFPGAITCPLLRVADGEESRWLPVSVMQSLMVAAALEAVAAEGLDKEGDLADATEASKKALAACEDLLARFPDWPWRLPFELRCALLRRTLGQPAGDTADFAERVRNMPDGNVKAASSSLLCALLLLRGEREEAHQIAPTMAADLNKKVTAALKGRERQRLAMLLEVAEDGMELLFEGDPCAIGDNIFWDAGSPQQAIGPPDALGSEDAAWQPSDNEGAYWLEVAFDPPARAHGLSIVQSPVAGGVMTVDLIGPGGASQRVLKPSDRFDGNVEFPLTTWPVHSARIYACSKDPHAPNGVDAVKLRSPQGDRWAVDARGSEGRSDPLPRVPPSQCGRITNRFDRFTLTLAGRHGVHELSTTNGCLSLPAGEYSLTWQRVEAPDANGTMWSLAGKRPPDMVLQVKPGAATGFSCGLPLRAKPVLGLKKKSLSISAALHGAQGQKYELSDLRRGESRPPAPAFKIFGPDGAVVHSGKLEYG